MKLDERPREGEADPEAAPGTSARRLSIEIEDPGQELGGDPDPGVADHQRGAALPASNGDEDTAAPVGELQGIAEEVREHLLEARRIGADGDRIRGDVDGERASPSSSNVPRLSPATRLTEGAEVDRLAAKLELAGRDA